MEQELRAYFFNNMYLSGIHAGIQAQHCTVEMFLKHSTPMGPRSNMLHEWARNHKTTIVLNAGYADNLEEIANMLRSDDNPYPWGYFCESSEALAGAITSVGVILPDRLFNYDRRIEELIVGCLKADECWGAVPSEYEMQLIKELAKYKLMN